MIYEKLTPLVSMLKHGTAYVAQGLETYEQQYRERMVKNLFRKARELGYALVKPGEAPAETSLA